MQLNEDDLCRAFAETLRRSTGFLRWVLSQTKFSEDAPRARLLAEEQTSARPHVSTDNWWRHWWCRIPGSGKEGETDIFLCFERFESGPRFALHIENKKSSEFLDGQPEGYRDRARLKMNDPGWLSYTDFETVLIAPDSYRAGREAAYDHFDRFIPYEQIAAFVPEFEAVADHGRRSLGPDRTAGERSVPPGDELPWRADVNWPYHVESVLRYYRARRDLKFGGGRAFPVIDFLCARDAVSRDEVMDRFDLTSDDITTILSNVTMAIQRKGSIWAPEAGGWYVTVKSPQTYIVCPGFRTAWQSRRTTPMKAPTRS